MRQRIGQFLVDDSGQDLVEYSLLIALMAIILIAGIRTLGGGMTTMWNGADTRLSNAAAAAAS